MNYSAEVTTLKITTAFAAALTIFIISAPIASAEDATTQSLGSQAKLVNGDIVQGWTISNLKTSTDIIPYPVSGTLWEATATDQAIQGTATPIVSNLNARARSGDTYRALFQVATPQGVNPATLTEGRQTTGKVYFDVTGDTPDSVVYNAGGHDLIIWVQPLPSATQTGTQTTPYPSRSQAPSAPAGTATAPALADAEAAPAAVGSETAPPPPGNQETPVPPGSQGTPLPSGTEGAALPAGSDGTPLPADSQGTPLPPGSQGTPLPSGTEGAALPAGTEGAALPAGSDGTPLPPGGQETPLPAGCEGEPLPLGCRAVPLPAVGEGTPRPASS
jgi:hypothetical protein